MRAVQPNHVRAALVCLVAALAGAVRSDLDGVRLQSNVVRESDRVRVYLTGLGDSADTPRFVETVPRRG